MSGVDTRAALHFACDVMLCVSSCCRVVALAESLRRAVENNLVPLSNMLELAQRMRNLKSFVHMSTAYVNAFRDGLIAEDDTPPLPGVDAEVVLKQVRLTVCSFALSFLYLCVFHTRARNDTIL